MRETGLRLVVLQAGLEENCKYKQAVVKQQRFVGEEEKQNTEKREMNPVTDVMVPVNHSKKQHRGMFSQGIPPEGPLKTSSCNNLLFTLGIFL